MRRPPMPVDELGLLCLLEKVGEGATNLDGYAHHALFNKGLVTGGPESRLTTSGQARLAELRAWREEGDDA